MSFAVVAELPLGAYRARTPEGGLDVLPAPARLHAALFCAAASGPRAVEDNGVLRVRPEDEQALAWVEQHPPDGVALPRRREVRGSVVAYRREGMLTKEKPRAAGPRDKVFGKAAVGLVAVAGPFAWTWDEAPPDDVAASLAALCPDVSHLGTSETPARLRVGEATATHRRDPRADLFTGSGLDLDVARPGRGEALRVAYHQANGKPPSVAADKYTTSEAALPSPVAMTAREPARYVTTDDEPEPAAPWQSVLRAELSGRPVADRDLVAWAVAAHRALVSTIGYGAPPLLTGAYEAGSALPANRVAIQFLTGAPAEVAGLDPEGTTLLVLIPTGADPVEVATVGTAFRQLPYLRRAKGPVRRLTPLPEVSAASFWPSPSTPSVRRWRTDPAAIPDTRPLRGGSWSMADVVRLSVALTTRDIAGLPGGRGTRWYRSLAEQMESHGVTVEATERVREGDLSRWVHKLPPGVVVQPYRAVLRLGRLLGDRALVAIGQSRHLGGGLLVPDGWAEA